jgi:pilus assembly protein Flp/PilA
MTYLKNFINDEEGQDLVEYALLLALVAVMAVGVLTTLSTTIQGVFTNANTALK